VNNKQIPIITLDGHAGSGKGSLARYVAKQLNFHYLDSGAIYRSIATIALKNNLSTDLHDDRITKLVTLITQTSIEFVNGMVLINAQDFTNEIRQERIGKLASQISKVKEIRNAILNFQRSFAKLPGLITDGRDMGSIVFPNALLKIFVTADINIRAQRRYLELQKLSGFVTMSSILDDLVARDKADSERKISPLFCDESFKTIDTTCITIEQGARQVVDWFRECSRNLVV
jgi:cytidylate kinase